MTKKRKVAKSSRSVRTRKRAPTRQSSKRRMLSIATNQSRKPQERIAAMAAAPTAVCEASENLDAMLGILRNREEPVDVRLAALQTLQAASFSVVVFEPCRADYIATLRDVAEDPEPEVRQRVLGILVREKDGFAQRRLLEGLQRPDKALVPPEKALQLLSYDPHADAYPAARAIVDHPPNEAAKREALRLLAADATAGPLFEQVLRNKTESPEIRQMAAAALNAIEPETFQVHAREIVLDADEPDEVQATSLTALTQFGNPDVVGKDEMLKKRIDALSGMAPKETTDAARRFLKKYGQ